MFLEDALEHSRIASAVPRSLGIDHGNWTAFADAEAIGLRPEDSALFR
jgi:hypothetical protein